MTTIRPATPTDKPGIIEMRLALQRHDEASNPRIWHSTEEGDRNLGADVDEMLRDEDGLALVVEDNGDLMGFAYGRVSSRKDYLPETVGFINLIYIKEGHRRQGTGRKLVTVLCSFFRTRDVDEVNLNHIKGNTEGANFWRKLGFEIVRVTANTTLEALEKRLAE